jgi:hypothetical protein
MTAAIWRRNDEWIGTEFDGSFIMVNIDTGFYVALNSTASAVWAALENPATETDIAAFLIQRFDVAPEQCQISVASALQKMHDMNVAYPTAS